MENIDTFVNNGVMYYSADALKAHNINKVFFIGCKSMRKAVTKHKILPTEYIFMANKKVYDQHYKPAHLYLSEAYVIEYILNTDKVLEMKQHKKDEKFEEKQYSKQNMIEKKKVDYDNIQDEPTLIVLEDKDKMKDENGIIMEIEMRGERKYNNIFLKVSDVGKVFGLDRVECKITHPNSNYEYGIHFVYFCTKVKGVVNYNVECKNVMYMTYKGLIKLLYNSRSKNADTFQDWAAKSLFTIQLGEQNYKNGLAANLLNVNIKIINEVFCKSKTTIPCVYLFKLGNVGSLKDTFNISNCKYSDDDIVYKFGMTNDIKRRSKEHAKTLGQLKNVNMELDSFTYIDTMYMSEAETKLSHYFQGFGMILPHETYNELVVIPKINYKYTDELYNDIGHRFMGRNKELISQIKDLKNEIMNKDLQLANKDLQLANKDLQLENVKQNEKQTIEMCQLKLQLMEMKHNLI
jgi:hypothetical protein